MRGEKVPRELLEGSQAIAGHARRTQWRQGLCLLETLELQTLRPDQVARSAAMAGCSRGAAWGYAPLLLSFLWRDGVEVDIKSYSAVFIGITGAALWGYGLHLLEELRWRARGEDIVAVNSGLSSFEKAGHWWGALALLDGVGPLRLQPDLVSFNAAASACEKGGQWLLAMQLLRAAKDAQLQPDVVSLAACISAAEKCGRWAPALALLGALRDAELETSVVAHNAASSACEKGHVWPSALAVLSALQRTCQEQSVVSFAAACSACEKRRRWDLALLLQTALQASGLEPNLVLRGSLVSACEKDWRWQEALHLLEAFGPWRVSPQEVGFAAATSACEKAKEWCQALCLVMRMHACGFEPYVYSVNAALSSLEKAAEWARALQLLSALRSWRLGATATSCSALVSACEKARQLAPALALLRESREKPRELPSPGVIAYNAVLVICRALGEWQLALWLLATLESAPSPVTLEPAAGVLESRQRPKFLPRLLQRSDLLAQVALSRRVRVRVSPAARRPPPAAARAAGGAGGSPGLFLGGVSSWQRLGRIYKADGVEKKARDEEIDQALRGSSKAPLPGQCEVIDALQSQPDGTPDIVERIDDQGRPRQPLSPAASAGIRPPAELKKQRLLATKERGGEGTSCSKNERASALRTGFCSFPAFLDQCILTAPSHSRMGDSFLLECTAGADRGSLIRCGPFVSGRTVSNLKVFVRTGGGQRMICQGHDGIDVTREHDSVLKLKGSLCKAEADNWKTTYEVMNEMRSFARSPYPPGTAIHQPGSRDHFGFSAPGPIANRLANADLCLTEDTDVANPREHMAITRIQEPDDRRVFEKYDVDEMVRTYNSPVAKATLSPTSGKGMSLAKTFSLPTISRRAEPPPKLSERNPVIHKLEDAHFSYFVPKNLQREHRDRLNTSQLSKLKKANMISFPFSGEGTGFRSQGSLNNWFPSGSYENVPTSYRLHFSRPGFFRANSPYLQKSASGPLDLSAANADLH
ncbi:unnamed protein product [Effrenium voratum]|nr:unnamed protein product [Effrenium voratum]